MKLLAIFLAILAVAASCYKHAHLATNPCPFPHKCSLKQQVACQNKEVLGPNFWHGQNILNLPSKSSNVHKPIEIKWPKVLPMNWAKLIEAPKIQTVMPNITHCIELERLLKNYKAIEMGSANVLPMNLAKLIEACSSDDVVPDINLKSLPEKYLDNHRDKSDKAVAGDPISVEIGSPNVQLLSSAKPEEVSRSGAVVPDINLKTWSEKYLDNRRDKPLSLTEPTEDSMSDADVPDIGLKSLSEKDNHRDKNDKAIEMKSPNTVPVIPPKLIQVLRGYAAIPNCISCINLIRKQEEQLDDNGSLKLPLRSYDVILDIKPCNDLSQTQNEYLDYEEELQQDNSIETPAATADISPEILKDYFNDVEPDFLPFEDQTRKQQENFYDKEDLDNYRKHGRSRKHLS